MAGAAKTDAEVVTLRVDLAAVLILACAAVARAEPYVQNHNWRGENSLRIGKGAVTLTGRPMGTCDHKFSSHRQHVERWRWQGRRYVLEWHQAPPPEIDRQAVNDAEAYFRRQEYAAALPLFRRALVLAVDEQPGRGWKGFARLRLGQALALLGRDAEARRELAKAAGFSGPIREAAVTFRDTWAQSGLVKAWTVLAEHHPWKDLAPPEVILQAFFERGGDWRRLREAGFSFVTETAAADLDGDGRAEVWVGWNGASYNPDVDGYLAVRTKAGWRVGEANSAGRGAPQVRTGPRGAISSGHSRNRVCQQRTYVRHVTLAGPAQMGGVGFAIGEEDRLVTLEGTAKLLPVIPGRRRGFSLGPCGLPGEGEDLRLYRR